MLVQVNYLINTKKLGSILALEVHSPAHNACRRSPNPVKRPSLSKKRGNMRA